MTRGADKHAAPHQRSTGRLGHSSPSRSSLRTRQVEKPKERADKVLAQGPRQEPRQVSLETKPEDF
jgi:hypothetical protein